MSHERPRNLSLSRPRPGDAAAAPAAESPLGDGCTWVVAPEDHAARYAFPVLDPARAEGLLQAQARTIQQQGQLVAVRGRLGEGERALRVEWLCTPDAAQLAAGRTVAPRALPRPDTPRPDTPRPDAPGFSPQLRVVCTPGCPAEGLPGGRAVLVDLQRSTAFLLGAYDAQAPWDAALTLFAAWAWQQGGLALHGRVRELSRGGCAQAAVLLGGQAGEPGAGPLVLWPGGVLGAVGADHLLGAPGRGAARRRARWPKVGLVVLVQSRADPSGLTPVLSRLASPAQAAAIFQLGEPAGALPRVPFGQALFPLARGLLAQRFCALAEGLGRLELCRLNPGGGEGRSDRERALLDALLGGALLWEHNTALGCGVVAVEAPQHAPLLGRVPAELLQPQRRFVAQGRGHEYAAAVARQRDEQRSVLEQQGVAPALVQAAWG